MKCNFAHNSILMISFFFINLSQTYALERLPFNDQRIQYIGRTHFSSDSAQYDWPCHTIKISFLGSGHLNILMNGMGNRFKVTIDKAEYILQTRKRTRSYKISGEKPLKYGLHHIELRKLTEAGSFVVPFFMRQSLVKFYAFEHSKTLYPMASERRLLKIEFFGDSSMNGFGALGDRKTPLWRSVVHMLSYQSCDVSYPAEVGRLLQSEIFLEAWSGKGLIKNAVSPFRTSRMPMLRYWKRTLARRKTSEWNFSKWVPDVVVIDLGSNDFFNFPKPYHEAFFRAYEKLLRLIRESYQVNPMIQILILCGGLDQKAESTCPAIKQLVKRPDIGKVHLLQMEKSFFSPDEWGTLGHLNRKGNKKLGQRVADKISLILTEINP